MSTEEIKTEIDEEDRGMAYLAEGRKRFMDNDIRGAISYLQKAAILFDIDNDYANYCETMNVLGVALAANGNDAEALEHYLEGLDCAVQHKIRLSSITLFNNIGSKYQELGFDDRALDYLLKAAEIADTLSIDTDPRLPLWKLVIDMNIANAYRMLSQYEKARTYLERAKCEDVWKDEESVRVFYLSYQVSLACLLWDLGEKEKAAEMVPELVELAMKDRNVSNYQQDIMDLLALLEKMGDRSHWEIVLQSFEQYASRHDSPDVKIASLEAWIAYFKYFELKDKYREACVLYTEQSLEMKAYKNRERAEAMDLKISMREKDIATRKYQALANYDALTGTGNRNKLESDSSILFQNAIRERTPLTIGIFDLDHFKEKNDAYGHLIGDAYMTCLVRVMEKTLGTLDRVYRFGGDEFVVILTDLVEEDLKKLAGKVQKALHEEQLKDDMLKGLEEITVSQGYAMAVPEEGDAILDLLDAADKALYYVKEHGRNNFVISDYRDANEAGGR